MPARHMTPDVRHEHATCVYACTHASVRLCMHACMHPSVRAYVLVVQDDALGHRCSLLPCLMPSGSHRYMCACVHAYAHSCAYAAAHVWLRAGQAYSCVYATCQSLICNNFYTHASAYECQYLCLFSLSLSLSVPLSLYILYIYILMYIYTHVA